MISQIPLCILLTIVIAQAGADTPANCTFSEISGKWVFYETARTKNKHENCTVMSSVERKIKVDLQFPNIAVDEFGNLGIWTMVYNEGFEVTVNGRTYFAFSYYEQHGANVTSYCDRTIPGWAHDVTLRHWSCFYGRKSSAVNEKIHQDPFFLLPMDTPTPSREDYEDFVRRINSKQSSWKAEVHMPFLNKSHHDLLRLRGGKRSWLAHRPSTRQPTRKLLASVVGLPEAFDWRNVNGMNFVSPVRNQGSCGSCYAFSSMGMLEGRVRVRTNNTMQPQFSPQDIVSCSELSQGCEGGFPFLIAGRYGKDFGVVYEKCNPYRGEDHACSMDTCYRHYTADYSYVGGYYGACNEYHMQRALIEGGPLSVSFEVHSDFMSYKGGIYHYTGLEMPQFNPFVLVNHAVLLVGYGTDSERGEKYWIIKNSWGEQWGESGYFRIRRGCNEVGIESIAVQVTPIP